MNIKFFAYFISPYGDVIPLKEDRHIHEIILHPDKFGLTKKEIEAVYKKHKEVMGVGNEGESREEIIGDLLAKGWARVRYITRDDSFTVQVYSLDKRQKENIYDWAGLAIKQGGASKYTGISIMEIKPGGGIIRGTLEDVLKYKIFGDDFEESVKFRKSKAMVFIENYIVRKK
jgi:hypothetical protein